MIKFQRKTRGFFSLLLLLLLFGSCQNTEQERVEQPVASDVEVEKLISEMSLVDKVGQMTQLTLDMVLVGPPYGAVEPQRIDSSLLRKVIVDLRVGSILNCGGHTYPRSFWNETIKTIQDLSMSTNGIPVLYGIDAIHGVNYTDSATLFPQQIGLAATWNPDIVRELAEITAYETRASSIPWNFSPVLDIGRDVRWPRLWETFGEDPYLASTLATAMIEGYQGDDISDETKVASCMKHFLGYSQTLTGKDRTQAWIPERQLREYFLPTFEAAIDAGAKTVMVNSGEINGIPVHVNSWVLKDLLRDELGFDGLIVTDWEDIKYLVSRHRVAVDYKEAIKMAIDAGIDMSMVPVDYDFPVLLRELVEEGEIEESRLDESVRRILTLKKELGLFDSPYPELYTHSEFASEASRQKSELAAKQSITLLKNEAGILPLADGADVFVDGPNADNLMALNGGWSHTWQGTDPQYNTPGKSTVKDLMPGGSANSKYIVLCLGESPYTEKVGDIEDITLAQDQLDLVKDYADKGKKIIVVLLEGRPRIISEIEPLCDAIVMAYLPGDEGAEAIRSVLFGEFNPEGKLPFTYPRHPSSHTTYDHKYTDRLDPQFGANAFQPQYEFGHGLSYTSFEYSDLVITKDSVNFDEDIEISISIENTGSISGRETVMLFVSDSVASITPSVKRLRSYQKIGLAAGEKKTCNFKLNSRDLAFVGRDLDWISEPGDFIVRIGGLSEVFYMKGEDNKVFE